jgi:glyoxylase-like metal-dependent hydrolase (beta-lactamase superfamily II)
VSALPAWVSLVLAPNAGPMTLDGTNTWVLSGPGGVIVVDPGPLDEAHLAAVAQSGQVRRILLTHGHLDHAEGAERLHRMTGAPVAAVDARHRRGTDSLDEGDRLHEAGLTIDVWTTPGHSSDSVTFVASQDGATVVLTGDTILGRGTTLVDHPEGRLRDYLESLERLAAIDASIPVLPGHGPAGAPAASLAERYLVHRRRRLDEVRAALAAGARTPREIVAVVYADLPAELWRAAERSTAAQLLYLEEDEAGPSHT